MGTLSRSQATEALDLGAHTKTQVMQLMRRIATTGSTDDVIFIAFLNAAALITGQLEAIIDVETKRDEHLGAILAKTRLITKLETLAALTEVYEENPNDEAIEKIFR